MLLGLDLGTTAVKAVVLDPERGLLASDSLPNAPASPHPGWSEQDAGAWLVNALELIPRVCAAAGVDAGRDHGRRRRGLRALRPAARRATTGRCAPRCSTTTPARTPRSTS